MQKFTNFEVTMMHLMIFNIIVAKYILDSAKGVTFNQICMKMSLVVNAGFVLLIIWKVFFTDIFENFSNF